MNKIKMSAGKYFLGDCCYAVPNDLWGELLNSCDYFEEPIGTVRGYSILGLSTAYGDGYYPGSDGKSYGVDAGLIGLVPEEFIEKYPKRHRDHLESLGSFVEFSEDFECWNDNGTLHFGHIFIETGDENTLEEKVEDDELGELDSGWDCGVAG